MYLLDNSFRFASLIHNIAPAFSGVDGVGGEREREGEREGGREREGGERGREREGEREREINRLPH